MLMRRAPIFRRPTFSAAALVCASLLAVACSSDDRSNANDAAATAIDIAQHYVDGYYHQFPGEAYEIGYPDTPMDRFGDRGVTGIAAWQAQEDGWLDTLRSLDQAALEGTDGAVSLPMLEAAVVRWMAAAGE